MIRIDGRPADAVSALDRGLQYGDGVFRTLRVVAGRPRCWRRHYAKLAADCTALAIEPPAEPVLAAEVKAVAADFPDAVVKIIVTRGAAARGYGYGPDLRPTRVVSAAPAPNYPPEFTDLGIAAHLCELRLAVQPRLAGIKHLNRLENVLARAEWRDPTVPEGLLRDPAGNVIEGTMTNLFIIEGSALLTPALDRCGVAGVQRDRVVEAAARLGLKASVADIPLERALAADEMFLVNSVVGAWQVQRIEARRWAPGKVTPRVRQWLYDEDDA